MGRTGQALAAYLVNKKQNVTVWNRTPEKLRKIASDGIITNGVIHGVFSVETFDNIHTAIDEADYIILTTVARAHKQIAEQLSGRLKPGQTILIFNGNLGAYEFYSVLAEEASEKNIIIAETGGMILSANFAQDGSCYFKSLKQSISLSAIPSGASAQLAKALREIFPQFVPVQNIAETSFNNANPMLHVPLMLFNITRVENREDFLFYDEAATRSTLQYVEKIDKERCEVIRALGCRAQSCLEIINSFWPDKYDTLFHAIKNNKGYMAAKGPLSFDHRYITEDIPYGIVPISILGRRYGVKTPYIDSLLKCFEGLLSTDFESLAPDMNSLDIKSLL